MAIEKASDGWSLVRGVATGRSDAGEPCVTWNPDGGRMDAYVVCAVEGPPVTFDDLCGRIADDQLAALCSNGDFEVELAGGRGCHLWGITRRAFEASGHWRVDVKPPARVQVWAVKRNYSEVTLFVPDRPGGECCAVPARYRYDFTPGKPAKRWKSPCLSHLVVHVESPERYADGALRYTAGGCPPLPIPRRLLGQDIPLMLVHPDGGVDVAPAPGREPEYRPY